MDEQIQKAVELAIMKAGLVSNDHISVLIADLEKNLKISFASEIDQITKPLVDRVEALEGKLSIYEAHLNEMENRLENAEQESRRSCLRIFGVPLPKNGDETSKNCLTKVKKVFKDLEGAVPDDCIDRAHRIGRVKTNDDGQKQQAVIVKFRSWEKRVAVYKARKKLDNIKILLDLTPTRAKLLSAARERVKSHPGIQYAFVDINCRLGVKLIDDSLKFFSTERELEQLL
eukprot:Seg1749.1 transcript_id=Seg1749.1/GoldUCD/mRNA.D3Y31 product="hypothetical protein" protein_id=Seg1749.1/GoldUCD/D3Y31